MQRFFPCVPCVFAVKTLFPIMCDITRQINVDRTVVTMNLQQAGKKSGFRKIIIQTLIVCFFIGLIWFFKTLPDRIIEREMNKQLSLIQAEQVSELEKAGRIAEEEKGGAVPKKIISEKIIPEKIIYDALRHIKDPEIDINVVDLGLIRDVQSDEKGITVTMILTTRFCPYQGKLVGSVKEAVKKVSQSDSVKIIVDYSQTWTAEKMSDAGKKQWGHFFRSGDKK